MFQKHTLHLSQHGKDLLLQSYYYIVGKMIKLRMPVFLLISLQELSHTSTPAQPLPATQKELIKAEHHLQGGASGRQPGEHPHTAAPPSSASTWSHPSRYNGLIFNTVLVIQKDYKAACKSCKFHLHSHRTSPTLKGMSSQCLPTRVSVWM